MIQLISLSNFMKKILLGLLLMLPIASTAQHFIPVTPSLLSNKSDTVVAISPYNVAVINNVFKQRNQLQSLITIQEKALLQSDILRQQMLKTIQHRDSLIQQNTAIINRYKALNNNQEQQISLLLKDVEKQKRLKKFYKKTTVIAIIVATVTSLKLCNVF